MRGTLVIALGVATGCGFHTGGQSGPSDDAPQRDAAADSAVLSDAGVDQMTDAVPGLQCPGTYAAIAAFPTTSRYRFESTTKTWLQAEQDCEDDAGAVTSPAATHLIVLDEAAERAAMIAGLAGNGNLNDQWVGATDLADEGTVAYVTAQQTTLTLAPGMQDDNKDCIRMKSGGNTEFRDCEEQNRFVCECDGAAADPGRYPNFPHGNN